MARAEQVGYIANGTVRPSRFVKLDQTAAFHVLEADAAEQVIGISDEGSRGAPGVGSANAALAGDPLKVYQETDVCLLEIGSGGCDEDDYLKSDADGKGVAASAGDSVGARALQPAIEGDLIRVKVQCITNL